jgi:hypothetical protein
MKFEGKNLLDEGVSGKNARESTGRFAEKGKVESLAASVRAGIGEGMNTNTALSKATSEISKAMGENTIELQKIVEAQTEETQKELKTLIELIAKSTSLTGKKAELAIKKINDQIARLEKSAGDGAGELTKTTGVDAAGTNLNPGFIQRTFKNPILRSMRADEGLGLVEGFKQAFVDEPDKAFGTAGVFAGLGHGAEKRRAEKVANTEVQGAALEEPAGAIQPDLFDTDDKTDTTPDLFDTDDKTDTTKSDSISKKQAENNVEKAASVPMGTRLDKGLNPTEKLLTEIRDILKNQTPGSKGGGGVGILPMGMPKLKTMGKFLGRVAAPVAAVTALAKDTSDIFTGNDGGANNENKAAVSGSVIGGAIGLALGGPVGMFIGSYIGNVAGEKFGKYLDEREPKEEKDENGLNPDGSAPPRPTNSGHAGKNDRSIWDKAYSETHNADGTPKDGTLITPETGIVPIEAQSHSEEIASTRQEAIDNGRVGLVQMSDSDGNLLGHDQFGDPWVEPAPVPVINKATVERGEISGFNNDNWEVLPDAYYLGGTGPENEVSKEEYDAGIANPPTPGLQGPFTPIPTPGLQGPFTPIGTDNQTAPEQRYDADGKPFLQWLDGLIESSLNGVPNATGDALSNTGDAAQAAAQMPIINNITNNNSTVGSGSAPVIVASAGTSRNSSSTITRFQDGAFAGTA